jgi:membrane protein YqaA with SNARE-associated domain
MKVRCALDCKSGTQPRIPYTDSSRRAFRRWESFTRRRTGTIAMFIWATAEATVWPIIPDFLLLPMVVGERRRPHIPLLAAVFGSAIGGSAWHAWASIAPDAALRLLQKIPLVRPSHIAEVQARLSRAGPRSLAGQPWSGIGLKVWAPVVAASGIPFRQALPIFMASHALRMALVTALTAALSRALERWIRALALPLAVTYLAVFFRLWWRVSTRDYAQQDR